MVHMLNSVLADGLLKRCIPREVFGPQQLPHLASQSLAAALLSMHESHVAPGNHELLRCDMIRNMLSSGSSLKLSL